MKKIVCLLITLLIIMPKLVLAFSPLGQETVRDININTGFTANNNFNPATNGSTIHVIVAQVVQVFLGLLGTIFIILLVVAGYNWMTAMGVKEKVEKAQTTIRLAIIGLVIILAAYIITYFIFLAVPGGGASTL